MTFEGRLPNSSLDIDSSQSSRVRRCSNHQPSVTLVIWVSPSSGYALPRFESIKLGQGRPKFSKHWTGTREIIHNFAQKHIILRSCLNKFNCSSIVAAFYTVRSDSRFTLLDFDSLVVEPMEKVGSKWMQFKALNKLSHILLNAICY